MEKTAKKTAKTVEVPATVTIEELAMNFEELLKRHNVLVSSHNALVEEVNSLREVPKREVRDRGPQSTREMTEDDAEKIMLGELKDASHRKAAEELGLSYGQVYSARNGFTFKGVYKKMMDARKD